MSSSFAPRADETEDMSLNSISAVAGAEDGGTTVHSTGAFSSLGYTKVSIPAGVSAPLPMP